MKAIILAAGYATRLYPLTKKQPKPLLQVGGKAILDHIVEKMDPVESLDEIFIVTNKKFANHFKEWSDNTTYQTKLMIVNDGTSSNEDRLGALGDIQFTIEKHNIEDDLMVVAGDNLFGFKLTSLANYFEEKQSSVISIYKERNPEQLIRGGTAAIDENQKIIGFEEKPKEVNYPYSVPTFYILKKEDLPLLDQYINEGNDADANGNFIPYLISNSEVYGFIFDEYRYDIGTLESYRKVQKIFELN